MTDIKPTCVRCGCLIARDEAKIVLKVGTLIPVAIGADQGVKQLMDDTVRHSDTAQCIAGLKAEIREVRMAVIEKENELRSEVYRLKEAIRQRGTIMDLPLEHEKRLLYPNLGWAAVLLDEDPSDIVHWPEGRPYR